MLTNRVDKQLRIVINSLDCGGAEMHLLRILPKLIKRGIQLEVIVLKAGGVLSSEFQDLGVNVRQPPKIVSFFKGYLRFMGLLVVLAWLCYLFIKDRKSILHFFLPEAYILGGFCAWLTCYSSPMIMSRRSLNCYQKKYPLARKLEEFLHIKMDMILGNSQRVIEQLQGEGVAQDKLRLIYNGLDISLLNNIKCKDVIRHELRVLKGALVLVKVANLIPYKGHVDLLHALGKVKDELPENWKLLCVGKDNGCLADLKELAEELQLARNIEWLGSRSDVLDIISIADIGLLCSHEEGFSNAILEYMALSLPVIATDVGGNAEAVLNQVTGYVVESRNVDAISGALLDMAKNRKKRLMMGRNGKNSLIENFSLDHCISEYESVYMKVGR